MKDLSDSEPANQEEASQGSVGSFIVSALFIIAGIVTLYDTMSYSDIDSKVFPRAAAIVLILCASISLILGLIVVGNLIIQRTMNPEEIT